MSAGSFRGGCHVAGLSQLKLDCDTSWVPSAARMLKFRIRYPLVTPSVPLKANTIVLFPVLMDPEGRLSVTVKVANPPPIPPHNPPLSWYSIVELLIGIQAPPLTCTLASVSNFRP